MILFKLYNIEIKDVQKKPVETSANQFLATKYQISKHLGLNGTFLALQIKAFGPKKIKFHAGVKK